jgi:hypothetical protein
MKGNRQESSLSALKIIGFIERHQGIDAGRPFLSTKETSPQDPKHFW